LPNLVSSRPRSIAVHELCAKHPVASAARPQADGSTEVDSHDRHFLDAAPRFGLKGMDVIGVSADTGVQDRKMSGAKGGAGHAKPVAVNYRPAMPNPTNHSGIRDNHRRGAVADFLKARIEPGARLSVVSAYFTIYAYDALKESLDGIEHLDFLFGEPRFLSALDPEKTEKKSFILDAIGLRLANKLEQKRVARECADWIRQRVNIRSVRHAQLLHGKM